MAERTSAEKEPLVKVSSCIFYFCSVKLKLYAAIREVIVPLFLSGLISRAMPRDGLHGDSKERPLITGSIMQGNLLTNSCSKWVEEMGQVKEMGQVESYI